MRRLLAALGAATILLAACGDDDTTGAGGTDTADAVDEGDGVGAPSDDAADGVDAPSDDSAGGDEGGDEGEVPDPGDGPPRVGQDHWHAAYLLEICGQIVPPLPTTDDPHGIHSHGDGIIHIHPLDDAAAGTNATLGVFLEALGVELGDDRLAVPLADFEITEEQGCGDGAPAEIRVARWSVFDLDAEPEISTEGLSDVRFREDLEAYTIFIGPPDAEISIPPSVVNLDDITDADVAPELPDDIDELFPEPVAVDPPPEGESITGPTPCPEADGSSPRVTSFEQAPPNCLTEGAEYTAVFDTNLGEIRVALDTETTPETVNNFVVLARYHYYDDTAIFRTAPSIAIAQGGAPHLNDPSDPGPGYTIPDEADGFTYSPGDLAMARTAAPDSAGAQFFFAIGPETAQLDAQGTYVVFGSVLEGLDILEQILALHAEDPTDSLRSGPSEAVIIDSVTIEES